MALSVCTYRVEGGLLLGMLLRTSGPVLEIQLTRHLRCTWWWPLSPRRACYSLQLLLCMLCCS